MFYHPMIIPTVVTYETGVDQPLHPDFMVASRFVEVELGDCVYGCKIYADPRSNVKVLAHNRMYGCDKDQAAVDNELSPEMVRDCESVEV